MTSADAIHALRAETAYLFRHALLRDAAYELQTPGDRAKLHTVASDVLEALHAAAGSAALEAAAGEICLHLYIARQSQPAAGATERELKFLSLAAVHAENQFQPGTATVLWSRLAEVTRGTERADSLRRAGVSLLYSGKFTLAEECLRGARLAATRADAQACLEKITHHLAVLYHNTSRVADAEAMYLAALADARRRADRRQEGTVLGNMGVLYSQHGRADEGRVLYEQAMAAHRETGDRSSEALTLASQANLLAEAQEFAQAEPMFRQALHVHRELGDRRREAILLGNLALLSQWQGGQDDAESLYTQAIALHREVGSRLGLGLELGNLAGLLFGKGEYVRAERLFVEALAIHVEVGSRRNEGVHTCAYAYCFLKRGEVETARTTWLRGIALLRAIDDKATADRAVGNMQRHCREANTPPFE